MPPSVLGLVRKVSEEVGECRGGAERGEGAGGWVMVGVFGGVGFEVRLSLSDGLKDLSYALCCAPEHVD